MTKEMTVQNIDMMNVQAFEQVQRVARLFAESDIVPQQYRGNIPNCAIALMQSHRMGVDPFAFMQNSYVVHGRPGIEAKLAISLVNGSGKFTDPLDFEEDGDDPKDKNYRVRCVATRKSTGKELKGPWIDWDLVKAEQWDKKPGSKWNTMAQQMFMYRAAMFFSRLHCPEVLLGFQTVDELHDVKEIREINAAGDEVKPAALADQIKPKSEPEQPTKTEDPKPKAKEESKPEPKKKPEPKPEAKQEPTQEEAPEQDEAKELNAEEFQQSITEALATHCNGDMDKMDEVLSGAVGQKISVSSIPAFRKEVLPDVLYAVQQYIGAGA